MYSITTLIGDHPIRFTTWSEQILNWIVSTFHIVYKEEGHGRHNADLHVHIDDQFGGPFQSYDVRVRTDDHFICYKRSDYMVKINRSYTRASIYMFDEFALKHAILNLYSAFIIYHEWGLLLHASCVAEGEKAYVFAGQSGAGKSTVARLSEPRLVLADEVTIVKVRKQEATVYDSPFRSEIKSAEAGTKRRLEGIFILQASQHIQRLSLKKPDGILHLLNHLFYWSCDTKESNKVLTMCKMLAEQTSVARLHFQENKEFWKLIL
jgi:hypothetical protein